MKTKLFTLTSIVITSFVVAQNVNIPDANFKAYLVGNTAVNTNGDDEIQVSEAEAFTGMINCANLGISDLTGIEAFVNITELRCQQNQLTTLNVSSNVNLTILRCYSNQITNLDVSNNTNLTRLYCHDNQLATLDVSANDLEYLWCYDNQLTSLNVSNNVNLERLLCENNQLTTLDVSTNTSLDRLSCPGNQLTGLDVSNNPVLNRLWCHDNELTSLNLKNGNNLNFVTFYAQNNPNLTCIEVDDPAWSILNWTNIDSQTTFSEGCGYSTSPCVVNIPDPVFKAYLLAQTDINTNVDDEIQCEEAEAFTGSLFPIAQGIADMTGIEAFVNITNLYCGFNQLTSLDLSSNTQLEMIYCQNNAITDLNINGLTNLTFLFCSDNQLENLDVSTNTNMEMLWCYSNQIATLDISNNTNLKDLQIHSNQLGTLNLDGNTNLEFLNCEENQLTALDLSNKPNFKYLRCNNNLITSLDLSGNSDLTDLHCQFNQLSSLNVKNGNNTSLVVFNSIANATLTCIEVDDMAYSTANWTAVDAWSTFSEDCTVSVNDIFAPKNISVYPNPTNDIVNFLSNAPIENVIVSNMLGQQINVKLSPDKTSLDLSNLSIGNYFVKITTEDVSKTIKIMKQ